MKYLLLSMAVLTFTACSKKEGTDNAATSKTTTSAKAGFSELPDGWATGWMIGQVNQPESAHNRSDTMEAIYHEGCYLRIWDNSKTYHVMAVGNPTKYTVADSLIVAGVFNTSEELLCYIEVRPRHYKVNGEYVQQVQSFRVLDDMMPPKPPFNLKVDTPGYVWKSIWE